jgi:hypothetical protein
MNIMDREPDDLPCDDPYACRPATVGSVKLNVAPAMMILVLANIIVLLIHGGIESTNAMSIARDCK